MVPLLLLLLLPKSLAEQSQVCFNISESEIKMTTADAIVLDERTMNMKCSKHESACLFQCTFSERPWFNGSFQCLEADLQTSTHNDKTLYILQHYANCTMVFCNETSIILPMIASLHSDSSNQSAMVQLFQIRISCFELFNSNHEAKAAFINAERLMIHSIMETSQLYPESSKNYNLMFLSLNVFNISEAELRYSENQPRIQKQVPQLLPENASFIPETWLPVHALSSIPSKERIVGLVSYLQHSHFQFDQEKISSMVLRIELLGGRHLVDLNTSVKMIFRVDTHRDMANDTRLQCHYFDEQDWLWRTDGCETDSRTQDIHNSIVCNCNHTTPFAVLLIREPIAEVHWTILSYISYIGCSLSAFFTACSLVMYFFSRHHNKDCSISIHVSLSGALFLLNSTFLLTEWGATVEPDWVCVFVAALMHYSLLSCFTWMAIEALHLYLLLIKVFNTYYKRYLVKLSLVGWGVPGVIVAVSLGVKDFKQFYGLTTMTMSDTNQTNAICWITDDSFFYSLNLVYFTLTFIFNSGILMAVASSICKMKQMYRSHLKHGADTEGKTWRYPERFSASCRSGLTVLGLTCLIGTTWGLAFLGSGYVNYPVLYLFCILNSTQGFFIFLWICLSVQKQRKRDMESRMTSFPVNTSEIKTD
ncbi:adhesion G-protein coupled receptor G5 [Anabas testudineus]|uniref:adhesion G-protein coupled receptor G5 n=1 Tax=Anabas testudineus TaxID=64144 RepID=UPI000E455552|nr:adhesion G-protein coupled receptor G5 [Anabas testudineus]